MKCARVRISTLSVLLWAPAVAVAGETLESVQKTIIERSRNLSTLQFDMTTSTNTKAPGYEMTQNGKGRYEYLKRGDTILYRVDSKDHTVTKTGDQERTTDSQTTIIFDGEFLYTLTESDGHQSAVKMKQTQEAEAAAAPDDGAEQAEDAEEKPDDKKKSEKKKSKKRGLFDKLEKRKFP